MAVNYRRRFGDRRDGRRLRSLAPYYALMPYIMKHRGDASNFFADSVEISPAGEFLRQKRAEGYAGMGMLHLFIASYIRTLSYRPALNRFISGQKAYARHNIEVIMTIKRAMSTEAPETSVKVRFAPTDTLFDVYRKMNEAVDSVKANAGDNNTDQAAGTLMKLPGLLLKLAVWFLGLLDYFGIMPGSLVEASPFHGSLVITDLGSLGIAPIYHHLYNFGNVPVFISFGAKRRSPELDKDGRLTEGKYIDFTAVLDERICDGHYYASAFKYMKYFLKNPRVLETPPESVQEDVF